MPSAKSPSRARGNGGGSSAPPGGVQSVTDLATELSSATLDSLAHVISTRFAANEWYTKVGTSGSIVVGVMPPSVPVLQSSIDTAAVRDSWKQQFHADYEGTGQNALPVPLPEQGFKDPVQAPDALSPHVFSVVNDTLMEAKRSGRNQSIVFRGKNATDHLDLALSHLLDVARMNKKSDRFQRKVLAAHTLIRAFGSTVLVDAASGTPVATPQYADFMELLLDDTSSSRKVAGFKFTPLNLDTRTVMHVVPTVAAGQQPAHEAHPPLQVFRYLLMGVDATIRQALQLPNGFSSPHVAQGVAAGDSLLKPDESRSYAEFTGALETLGVPKKCRDAIWRVLASILHLGQLSFIDGGNKHGANKSDLAGSAAAVSNRGALEAAAGLLGVDADTLEASLVSEIKYIGTDRVSVFLKPNQAVERAAQVAGHLYHVLFQWIVMVANRKLAPHGKEEKKGSTEQAPVPTVSVQLMPVPTPMLEVDSVSGLLNNYIIECVDRYLQHAIFDDRVENAKKAGISQVKSVSYQSNEDVFSIMDDRKSGLVPLLNAATAETLGKATKKDSDATTGGDVTKVWLTTACTKHAMASKEAGKPIKLTPVGGGVASIQHAFGLATYRIDKFVKQNAAMLSDDVVHLARASEHKAVADLFKDDVIGTLVAQPSRKNKRKTSYEVPTVSSHLTVKLGAMLAQLAGSTPRIVFCLKHAPHSTARNCEPKYLQGQLVELGLVSACEQVRQKWLDLTVTMSGEQFVNRYKNLAGDPNHPIPPQATADELVSRAGLTRGSDLHVSSNGGAYIIPFRTWKLLEGALRKWEAEKKAAVAAARRQARKNNGGSGGSVYSDADSDLESDMASDIGDNDSIFGGAVAEEAREMEGASRSALGASAVAPLTGADNKKEEVEEVPVTSERRKWVAFTWLMTWWIPTWAIRCCGKMSRPDIQLAWREKVAICIVIFWLCVAQLFFIIGLGPVICPRQKIYNNEELYFKTDTDKALVAIYGNVYRLEDFVKFGSYHPANLLWTYAGLDLTAGFPRTPAFYCQYAAERQPNFAPFFNIAKTVANGTLVQVRHKTYYDRDRYNAEINIDRRLKLMTVANLAFSPEEIEGMSKANLDVPRKLFSINNIVYDIQPYRDALPDLANDFLPQGVLDFVVSNAGKDLTKEEKFMTMWRSDSALRNCFNNLFIVGIVDERRTPRCQVTNWVLLGFSCILVAVIFVKFLAALQVGRKPMPENLDKFVVLQVPCYTEDEVSLRKTLDSLATTRYDDKRKLLVIICDGNVIGSGNDRPTPRIVLDILGVDPEHDPEPKAYFSLGENMKQYNMGKVYSGLYEIEGHLVPYLVVVKVGRPTETTKPGNRGKRDSQMILMRFFNKVYTDKPMSPLELEMYHHVKNIIGVNPMFYELLLQVDADTEIMRDSLTRLVAAMVNDTTIMGCCGETRLANEKDTWATMIQVYEYYISHHMAKAFESMFGSVTPGCFSIYRLRQPNKNTPVLCNNGIIEQYGNCNVDTLHTKNLLHLGEDRYLTTLMLKEFPNMKTIFTSDAVCETIAPDNWNVLLSQRRRWINSTIHNLVELLNIPGLCGFCLFSMRFVVFVDLLATFLQPATVGYLGYLAYLIIDSQNNKEFGQFPFISLILLAAIYGLQAIIFLIKREWQHIMWMIIYILAIPVFSFAIPVYSFWHSDDFSWGNTRVVLGDNGKKQVISNETEKFDPSLIPTRKWADYEQELYMLQQKQMDDFDDTQSVAAYGHVGMQPAITFQPQASAALRPMSMIGGVGIPGSGMPGFGTTGLVASIAQPSRPHSVAFPSLSTNYALPGASQPPALTSGFVASPMSPTGTGTGGAGLVNRRSQAATTSMYGAPAGMSQAMQQQQPSTPTLAGAGGSGNVSPKSSVSSSTLASNGVNPSDAVLLQGVREILLRSDLQTITKRQVRDELSAMLGGVDLRARREAINQMITLVLSEMS
ncbi:chitin synthase-domain-containing protein [Catenaria anguillulae PL171]|uniref:chitin synthase n=1 Tax=Catenaria anguillulae PL171 TaxID=765915 RepID=A0A1Y2H882_9FUNG|nr:chitin synthase-domain-containing protein [Catenaria anguillulae PL171]